MVRICDLIPNYPSYKQLCLDVIEYFQHSGYFNQIDVISENDFKQ